MDTDAPVPIELYASRADADVGHVAHASTPTPAVPPPPLWTGSETAHESRIARLEATVTALESRTGRTRPPWFRDVSALVAVLALVFSFGTTVVSLNRTAQQDAADRKNELLSLIDRLSSLNSEYASDTTTYANNPAVLGALNAVITQQELLAAEQAAAVMATIPNDVGSAEYTFVASVLVANGIDDPGVPLFEQAINRATNANDLVSALRSEAIHDYAIGKVDQGRSLFGQALLVFTRFPNASSVYVTFTHLQTQLGWTQGELAVHACDEARQHLSDATSLASGLGTSDARIQELHQLGPLVAACVPGPVTAPGAIPSLVAPAPSAVP
jgi:hypothetical protein